MTSAIQHFSVDHHLFEGDIPVRLQRDLARSPQISWDIETSGLNWSTDRIALCQLYAEGLPILMIRIGDTPPSRLRSLLENPKIQKVFHHAMFDLRFMAHHWSARPQNVACTKIAAKLLFPDAPEQQKLQQLVERFLGVTISKAERLSNWFTPTYSTSQLAYAAADVIHLSQLLDRLMGEVETNGLRALAESCFSHIPTRVELEVGGYGDVFVY